MNNCIFLSKYSMRKCICKKSLFSLNYDLFVFKIVVFFFCMLRLYYLAVTACIRHLEDSRHCKSIINIQLFLMASTWLHIHLCSKLIIDEATPFISYYPRFSLANKVSLWKDMRRSLKNKSLVLPVIVIFTAHLLTII